MQCKPQHVATPSDKAPAPLPRLGYSAEEAAEIVGVSRETLYREMRAGRGPKSFTVRGRRLFTFEALQDYATSLQSVA